MRRIELCLSFGGSIDRSSGRQQVRYAAFVRSRRSLSVSLSLRT